MLVHVVDVSAIVAQVGVVDEVMPSHFSRPIEIITDVDDTTPSAIRTRYPIPSMLATVDVAEVLATPLAVMLPLNVLLAAAVIDAELSPIRKPAAVTDATAAGAAEPSLTINPAAVGVAVGVAVASPSRTRTPEHELVAEAVTVPDPPAVIIDATVGNAAVADTTAPESLTITALDTLTDELSTITADRPTRTPIALVLADPAIATALLAVYVALAEVVATPAGVAEPSATRKPDAVKLADPAEVPPVD